MALCTLALEKKPTDVALSKSGTRLAVLANNHLAVFALDVTTRPIRKPSLLWQSDAIEGQSARHVAFLDDEQLYVLTDSWVDDESSLWRSEDQMLLPMGPLIENNGVDYRGLYVQLQNGATHRIDTSEAASDLPPQSALTQKFPAFAPDFKIANVDGQVREAISSTDDYANMDRILPLV